MSSQRSIWRWNFQPHLLISPKLKKEYRPRKEASPKIGAVRMEATKEPKLKLWGKARLKHSGQRVLIAYIHDDGTVNLANDGGMRFTSVHTPISDLELPNEDGNYGTVIEADEPEVIVAPAKPEPPSTRKLVVRPDESVIIFDYAVLTVEARVVVKQKTGEIHDHIETMKRSAIAIGQRLIEVKAHLEHGQWGAWLRTEFNWSDQTALNYMNAARLSKQIPNYLEFEDRLTQTAVAALAAKSTPHAAQEAAIVIAEALPAGQKLTLPQAKEIIAEAKQADPESDLTLTETGALVDNDGEIINRDIPADKTQDTAPSTKADISTDTKPANHKRIPMTNRAPEQGEESPAFDRCQTPAKALDPLLPYLLPHWTIWEPAQGEGLLVEGLYDSGFKTVLAGDILTGQDFFKTTPDQPYDCQVTNPPYSKKYIWLARCYKLGKPFALLLPVGTLGAMKAQVLFKHFGIEIILLDQRINFKMPEKGWSGNGAQFSTAWFTWGLNIGATHTYAHIKRKGEADE